MNESASSDESKCPFCKGEIESDALKCKHCGEWLDEKHRTKEEQVKKAQVNTGNVAKMIGLFIGLSLLLAFLSKSCS